METRRKTAQLDTMRSIMFSFDAISKYMDDEMRKHDTRASRIMILNILREKEGKATRKTLSEIAHRAPPSITSVVDTLEKQGLLRRIPNISDRRSADIVLTDKGWDTADRLFRVSVDIFSKIVSSLDKDEISNLRDLLRKVIKPMLERPDGWKAS